MGKRKSNQDAREAGQMDLFPEDDDMRRGEVTQRHRLEPDAVRSLLYTGIKQMKDEDTQAEGYLKIRAAKAASETMRNLHVIDRAAWGMESIDNQDKVIVIERSYGIKK
jgi:hypothetical protein